jgi:fumigallin biosynthesis monooxygenase-like protein
MPAVINGRQTAALDDEVVVFLIGMRINRLRALQSWLPAFRAMPRMLAELGRQPELGFIHGEYFWAGRLIVQVQYWRSFEKLSAYARARDHEHLPAWREFNQQVRDSGAVGVFHESYRVGPGSAETLYANMPPFGLGAAVGAVPVAARGQSANHRMDPRVADVPAVEPY